MRIPLATTLKNRGSTTAKDARLLNAFVEVKGGIERVVKRPALEGAFTPLEAGAGNGQSLFSFSTPTGQTLVGIQNDVLNTSPSVIAKRLLFGVQPSAVALNTAISPSVTVRILGSTGQIFNSSANVTLSLDNNPTFATLGGTVTRAAVAGTATFNDLTLNRSGAAFTLAASSSGLRSDVSASFNVATHLAFTVQPSSTTQNTQFSITVAAQDSANVTDTNYAGFITVAIFGGSGGTLGGNLQRLAVNGVATFPDLSIDTAGSNYSLIVSAGTSSNAYTPSANISNTFSIVNPYTLTSVLLASGPYHGYNSNPSVFPDTGGAISPSTVSGASIVALWTTNTSNVQFVLQGNRIQSFFTSLQIVTGTGVLTSASASYIYDGGLNMTFWTWIASGSIPSGTFTVVII